MTIRFTRFIKILSVSAILVVVFLSSNISTLADFEVSPYNSNRVSSEEKNWFIIQGIAGQKIRDSFSIRNTDKEQIVTTFTPKDSQILEDGSFTIIADKEPNKSTGNWLKLDVENVIIAPQKSSQVFFTVDIPLDTKDGEYAAGISTTQTKPDNNALKTILRKGLRTYIAVGSDFVLDANVNSLNIVDPGDENFEQIKESKSYFGKDNLLLSFEVENTGNIFGVLEAKYALKFENGTVFENTFSTQISPFVGKRTFYIITNQPYQTGSTEALLDYKIKPLNIEPAKVKSQKVIGVLSDRLNLNQNQLDNFSMASTKAFVKKGESTETVQAQENKPTSKDNNPQILFATAIVVILISAGGASYYFWYKRRANIVKNVE